MGTSIHVGHRGSALNGAHKVGTVLQSASCPSEPPYLGADWASCLHITWGWSITLHADTTSQGFAPCGSQAQQPWGAVIWGQEHV